MSSEEGRELVDRFAAFEVFRSPLLANSFPMAWDPHFPVNCESPIVPDGPSLPPSLHPDGRAWWRRRRRRIDIYGIPGGWIVPAPPRADTYPDMCPDACFSPASEEKRGCQYH